MNYCIMHYFWSKELATILSKLLTITGAFHVNIRTKYPIGEKGHGLNENTLLSRENNLSSNRNIKKKKKKKKKKKIKAKNMKKGNKIF